MSEPFLKAGEEIRTCTSGSGGAAESPSCNVAEGTFGGRVPVRPEEGVMDVEEDAHETDEEDAETLQLQVEFPTRVKGGEDREVKRLGDPRKPSADEVRLHELTQHVPYRNWCDICVRCKGKDRDHRKSVEG